MTGSDPGILDSTGRMDRQDPYFVDIDLSVARSKFKIDIPVSTVLAVDPQAYDSDDVPSSTLFAGYVLVRPEKVNIPPVRLEAGGNFKMPPTDTLYITHPAQASRMVRLYCLPRAYDLKFYLRYDAPFTGPFSTSSVAMTVAAALISPTQPGRRSLMIKNVGGNTVYVGAAGVTALTGMEIVAGQTLTVDQNTGAWYGLTATGASEVRTILEG